MEFFSYTLGRMFDCFFFLPIFPPLLTKPAPCREIELSLLTVYTAKVKISGFFYESDKYLNPLTVVGVVVVVAVVGVVSVVVVVAVVAVVGVVVVVVVVAVVAVVTVVAVVDVVGVVAVVAAMDGHLNQHPKAD